jgi:hypothetical protein
LDQWKNGNRSRAFLQRSRADTNRALNVILSLFGEGSRFFAGAQNDRVWSFD